MDSLEERAITQIDSVLEQIGAARASAKYDDLSDLGSSKLTELATLATAALDRLTPPKSAYRPDSIDLGSNSKFVGHRLQAYEGALRALRTDIANGYMRSAIELVHAAVFSDFLDMAEHLLSSGYKDAAAVIIGSTLEEHLRKLAEKSGVAVVEASGKPLKSDVVNAGLVKADAYNTLQQKGVTAWLGLRNDAAHGHYDRYDERQVASLLRDVRDFMIRHPA